MCNIQRISILSIHEFFFIFLFLEIILSEKQRGSRDKMKLEFTFINK